MDAPDCSKFWKTLQLYLKKPHVVNRRLATVIHLGYVDQSCGTTINASDLVQNTPANLEAGYLRVHGQEIQLNKPTKSDEFLPKDLHTLAADYSNKTSQAPFILVHKLLAKNLKVFSSSYEIVLIDFQSNSATFVYVPDSSSNLNPCSAGIPPYCVQMIDNQIHIKCISDDALATPKNNQWLQSILLPKLVRWSESEFQDPGGLSVESNSLVNAEEYNDLYNQLKVKYGEHMVKTWPEQTDAAKFVYEDVAIATYLIVLWRKERLRTGVEKLQSFVDLGCGNGLLVFILSSEGHQGIGIDLRKRGIWNTYPESTKLEIKAIVPSDSCLFPEYDWIIGNHSDELSPWVPVIAARSSPTTRYFLLPCCAFEFSGTKFQRRNTNESQYYDFMRYVQTISEVCGFHTQIDRLKIPSTKRVCLIGETRTLGVHQFDQQCTDIQTFIDSQTKSQCKDSASAWSNGFVARSDVELVRNCSTVNRSVQNDIVRKVFEHLLVKRKYLYSFGDKWNVGCQATLGELVSLVSKDQLKLLKSECGGLQTLLRNNHQIFRVIKGTVQIRVPISYAERLREAKEQPKKGTERSFVYKQKSCWFLDNHPDGCPFSEEDCSFGHFNRDDAGNHKSHTLNQ